MRIALACLVLLTASSAAAQPSTARVDAIIELPGTGPAHYLNVDVEIVGDRLAIEGCVSTGRGACRATSRVLLDAARSRELEGHLASMEARMRCPPPAAQPGDPTFTLTTRGAHGGSFEGALPRDPAQVAARTAGACAATSRVAWFLVQWFGVPGLTAPQG